MTYVNFTESEKEIIRDTLKLVIKDVDIEFKNKESQSKIK